LDDADLLRLLTIDPADLAPAPPWAPYRGTGTERIEGDHRCEQCGEPAQATRVVDLPGMGRRWLDTCRTHMLAVAGQRPSRMPSTAEGIAADLSAAAREAGVGLTIVTDDVVSR
jgi:hypothetical protein